MKLTLMISTLTFLLALLASLSASAQKPVSTLAHTRTQFSFVVNAPFEQVVPLFGAHEERKWAEHWDPQFIYPNPARDQQGGVFKVEHGQRSSVWINTALDLTAGHVQYAYVLNDAMTTLIDIHATRQGVDKTSVTVSYERTALIPEANGHVQHMTKRDEGAGKEWGDALNAYFASKAKPPK
ncbi:MAG: hypothetical protein P4M04_14485 [Acidobacteriota bacterium]|nr:hypothetical protein [Acidobacteriota bacterium]